MYSPDFLCRSRSRTGCFAAWATARSTTGGIVAAQYIVNTPAALMIFSTPILS